MSRQNELTTPFSPPACRSCALAVPIIGAAVILNAVLVVDQEVVVPAMIPKSYAQPQRGGAGVEQELPDRSHAG